jgi:hypothetical protein
MKKNDILWMLLVAALFALIAIPQTRDIFISFTSAHPYIGGFCKFAVLATLGELIAIRLLTGRWTIPKGVGYKMAIWGFLGMVIVLIFGIFAAGVGGAMETGLLPGKGSLILFAFFTSTTMNLTFAPTMMIFHRITDTFIEMKSKGSGIKIKVKDAVKDVDWSNFYSFVICKTIPFFWIPAHTITFMLSPEYRVLMAAMLSLALGLILAFAKKKAVKTVVKTDKKQ